MAFAVTLCTRAKMRIQYARTYGEKVTIKREIGREWPFIEVSNNYDQDRDRIF
jgi:hypothetical protein